jgi:hypothetical protein
VEIASFGDFAEKQPAAPDEIVTPPPPPPAENISPMAKAHKKGNRDSLPGIIIPGFWDTRVRLWFNDNS